MSLVDERGRLFGRWNLVDVLVLGGIVPLVLVGFGAWRLWRPVPVLLTRIEPASTPVGTTEIEVTGVGLRPGFMVRIGDQSGRYLFATATEAVVHLPVLRPGTYDVRVYDEAREIARLAQALTVTSPVLPPRPPPFVGPRFVEESRDVVLGGHYTVLRDHLAGTCALVYTSEALRSSPTQTDPRATEAVNTLTQWMRDGAPREAIAASAALWTIVRNPPAVPSALQFLGAVPCRTVRP